MSPKKRVRVNAGGFQHSNHEILGGKGKVFRVPNSGDVYQFQMWISEEKKYLRKSLKTKDLETAMKRGEDLYLQTYSDVRSGRKLFGITLQELSDAYLKWREEDVALGHITKARLGPMSSQMNHLLAYKGHQTGETKWYVDFDKCIPYFAEHLGCALCMVVCPWSRPGIADNLIAKLARKQIKPTPFSRHSALHPASNAIDRFWE